MWQNEFSYKKLENQINNRSIMSDDDKLNEAITIIDDLEKFNSKEAFKNVIDTIELKRRNINLFNVLIRVAASLFIPLLIATAWLIANKIGTNSAGQITYQEIFNPGGTRSNVVLPDGTIVWLNGHSSIKYPVPFATKSRDVSIAGEAFFDVKKDPDKPFIVKTGNINIEVLGTRFNCKAYSDDEFSEVVLLEGKVCLSFNNKENQKKVIMRPGERVVVNNANNEHTVQEVNAADYTGWTVGKFVLNATSMKEMAKMLERWYNVEVIIEHSIINDYEFTTTFENESLSQVLDLLCLSSPISVVYTPTVYNTNSRKIESKAKIYIKQKTKAKLK